MSAILSQFHSSFVDRDLNNPGAELALTAKALEIGERLQHRLLRHFLRIGLVLQDRNSAEVDGTFMRPHKVIECTAVTGANPLDERGFR